MLTPYLAEKMAAQVVEATHVSLHTTDPETTGVGEVTGGTPAYARVAITSWDPNEVNGNYQAVLDGGVFNVPADTEVLYAGLWNGAQFLASTPLTINTAEQSTVTITALYFAVL